MGTAEEESERLAVPDVPAHIEERDVFSVIVPEQPMAPLSVAEARTAIERVRR